MHQNCNSSKTIDSTDQSVQESAGCTLYPEIILSARQRFFLCSTTSNKAQISQSFYHLHFKQHLPVCLFIEVNQTYGMIRSLITLSCTHKSFDSDGQILRLIQLHCNHMERIVNTLENNIWRKKLDSINVECRVW